MAQTTFAVIDPVPATFIVVEAELGLAMVTDPAWLHEEKVYPESGVELML